MSSVSARPLSIGIDARAANEVPSGRGRVVRELLRALTARQDENTYICYARTQWDEPLDERFRWTLLGAPDPVWHAQTARAAGRECDVFLSTNSYLTAILCRAPSVVIIYDLVAFDRETSPNRRSALIEHMTLAPAVRRAKGLLCISQATADALVARFPHARSRITVAPLGAAPVLAAAGEGHSEEMPAPGFVLAVGTLEPRKNLPRLVEAYAGLPRELQARHPLVVVGARGWRTGPTVDSLRSLGDRCRVLGHVPDAALAELYRGCAAFCYPSLGEGFGLPVLEAMAAGAPVVTSDISSLPEVGGDAVVYVDPRSVESIRAGLARVLNSQQLRRDLALRARARAATFSWDQTANVALEALRQVARAA